ncbi:MAG: SurA N-terminal domain-containing protein [Desulfobacterales bacterium]
MTRRGWWLWMCCGLLAAWRGGDLPLCQAAQATLVDRIVAVVNDDIITLQDLEAEMRPFLKNLQARRLPPDAERQAIAGLRREVLDNLIHARLTQQEIQRQKITVTEAEVDRQILQMRENRSLSEEELRRQLGEEGLTWEEYRRQVKQQIERSRLLTREVRSKVVITRKEIEEYYEKNRARYGGGTQVHLWNLYVRLAPDADAAAREAARRLLEEARAEAASGRRAFEEIVHRAAADRGIQIQGGDLGFLRLESLTPALREAVRTMKAGEVSPVVASEFGYQVVYVQEMREEGGRPLAEVEAEIQETLYREVLDRRFEAWLADLRKRAHIRIVAEP